MTTIKGANIKVMPSACNKHKRSAVEAIADALRENAIALQALAETLQPAAGNVNGIFIQQPQKSSDDD